MLRLAVHSDLPLALSYSKRILKKQVVESKYYLYKLVIEANEKDFQDAKASGKATKASDNPGMDVQRIDL